MNSKLCRVLPWASALLFSSVLFFTACDISGSDDVVRQVSLNIAGAYTNDSGIPENQSGNRVTLLSIQQRGDQLSAVDNQGGNYSGSIGRADENLATFTLNGATSAGESVTLTGTVVVEGTSASLTGTWIEPSLRSSARASATVSGQVTPSGTPTPTSAPPQQVISQPNTAPTPARSI